MISDQEIDAVAEQVKSSVWSAADANLSKNAKDVVTAGELSAIAKAAYSAAYQALFRLKINERK